MAILVDRHETTPQEANDALANRPFDQPLPRGIRLDRVSARRTITDEGAIGAISYFDHRKTPRAEGGMVVIAYLVFRDADRARRAYGEYLSELRDANRVQGRGYRFFHVPGASLPHTCVDELARVWCQTVQGGVLMEAMSGIPMFVPERSSRIQLIFRSGVEHLRSATYAL
jgi:hypothetical protein